MFTRMVGGLCWLEQKTLLYLGQYHPILILWTPKGPRTGLVSLVISTSWTFEFSFQVIKVLKEQRRTGKNVEDFVVSLFKALK